MTPSSKPYTLYLVRHAIAADRGPAWPDDSKRPLTAKGTTRMREAARGLRSLDVTIDVILTSPLVRSKQTADALADAIRPAPPVNVVPALAPGGTPQQVAEALDAFRKARRMALIGHEPGLGELAAWFTGARAPLPFKKGGVCRIDLPTFSPAGVGQLVWFATPKMLRGLAKG
jgi:phosphohistidine phosphatase